MQDRITRRDCERLVEYVAQHLGRKYDVPRVEGSLTVWDESGVKRLREYSGSGMRDIGPGFTTWRELHGFLKGMYELTWLEKAGS